METFLKETARDLYRKYGEDISSIRILFPSRRARLFFNEALAGEAGKPLWQPRYGSIDELMEGVSGMRKSDSLRLVTELYKVYSEIHTEPFDSFYFWGEMLLSDFDSVDKYMIDAKMLFINLSDLKTIETDLSFLTPEQIAVIRRFWENFNPANLDSSEKKHFAGMWNSLYRIYTVYKERLAESGMAYTGMIYRRAAELLKERMRPAEIPGVEAPPDPAGLLEHRYAIVGFNALSETEKILFDYLHRHGVAEFYWDHDPYYTGNEERESGMFLRENLRRYPGPDTGAGIPHFAGKKEFRAVGAPSDAMQCRYVTEFLRGLIREGKIPDKETAIVLTDENLLLPVLHSVPPEIGKVNVTMGYPLRQTPAYTFVERLLELQQRSKPGNHTAFYHGDVAGLLDHPFVRLLEPVRSGQLAEEILKKQQVYVSEKLFRSSEFLGAIFCPAVGWKEICGHLVGVTDLIREGLYRVGGHAGQREYLSLAEQEIRKVANNLTHCGIEVADGILLSLIRKVLQPIRIPYEGEPLEGIQVMGILETRGLDFENILILSMNDDTFPGNLSPSSSFIPYNLRFAYGLPTPRHHEGVYAYYFYRLIQRAEKVHMVYSSKSDDRKTGEPSRYIYQLDYESPHPVALTRMVMDVNSAPVRPVEIAKDEKILSELERFTKKEDGRALSPSAAYTYIDCPLRFYYRYIAGLDEKEEMAEEIDLPMFGNIFHKAAELIYAETRDKPDTEKYLRSLLTGDAVDRIVERAVQSEYFKDEKGERELGGNIRLVAGIVRRYLVSCLLKYDAAHPDFIVKEVELRLNSGIDVPVAGEVKTIRLAGKADRVDLMYDGRIRIVDYKTGSMKPFFKGVESLFSESYADRNPAVFQTFLYSMMVEREWKSEVAPSIYYVRYMNGEEYSPYPQEILQGEDKKKQLPVPVERFSVYREEFEEKFREKLTELFDPSVPFRQCADVKSCSYCSFARLCGR